MDTKKIKEILKAMQLVEDDRKVDTAVVIAALEEAIVKAYRKHIDIPDVQVRAVLNEKTGAIEAYHQYLVVNEVEDEELEISLEDARKIDPAINLEGFIEKEIDIQEFGRAAALLAKNVVKQKIREAEKQAVYDEYIDLLDEMVLGFVESVEEKFVVVNLGKTLALMPKAAQIPTERYQEGQKIRVVITECNRESKGAQVLVSRADAKLVKRLFEKEVPEIYDGIVEIKAIAREAGDRCKLAVVSHNPEVDARGACIGPRGSRVQGIIEELKGEKIEIFEWSDDLGELIKNAFSPAEIQAVFYAEDMRNLVVVVDETQLSLAIGKKGKNARLAVKLTGVKIDIKTAQELEEKGIDIPAKVFEFKVAQERVKREKAQASIEKLAEELVSDEVVIELEPTIEEVVETQEDTIVETVVEEVSVETEAKEEKEVKIVKKRKELKPKTEYVSRFERLAEAPKPQQEKEKFVKKRKSKEDEERRLRAKDLKKDKDYEIKPVYSKEELEEIKKNEEMEASATWIEDEIDFDEFDEYYDEEV
ncbi:MAG: transcription termination factor NusA [Erysipelotrichaceae bacterium]